MADKKNIGKISLVAAVSAITGSLATATLQDDTVVEIPTNANVGYVMQYLTPKEKHDFKAKVFVDKAKNIKKFKKDNIDIEITDLSENNGKLKVVVRATKNGKKLKVNNPFYFVNPPIKIPDGTKTIITDEFGKEIEMDNFKEDINESLKEIIIQTIKLQNNL